MDRLFPLAPRPTLFRDVPLVLAAVLWLLWWMPLLVSVARQRGRSEIPALFLAFLGPLGLLFIGKPTIPGPRPPRFSTFHPVAWLVGSVIVAGAVHLTAWGVPILNGQGGEGLHAPLALALALSGVLAGTVVAWLGKRVGFFENMGITWVYMASIAVDPDRLESTFTFGTTAVFLVTILGTSLLILVITLLMGASIGFLATGDGELSLSFSYEAWIGRRYLVAKRRQSFISVITVISVAGVTVGVWAMLVVLSVMSGFEADLKTKILGANAHMIVQKSGGEFFEWQEAMSKSRGVRGVLGLSPFVFNEVMLSSDTNLTGALIKGVDVVTMDAVSDIAKSVVEGSFKGLGDPASIPDENTLPKPDEDWDLERSKQKKAARADGGMAEDGGKPPVKEAPLPAFGVPVPVVPKGQPLPGVVIGQEMARTLRVFVGDRITVVSPVAELGPTGPVPRARAFRVSAIFYSGMYEYDSKFAYIDLKEAQQFFTLNGGVTGIEVRVDDVEATTRIGRDIVRELNGWPYRTRDWKDMNRNLFAALKLEKIAMFIILAFIILVASFNILSTLIMVVLEKGKEIAILKSMGSTDASIMKVFVTYGLTIGTSGTLLGLLLGYVSCRAIETFGIGLDPEVYYIANLPVRMNPVEFVLVAVAALVISHLASVYPALQAARLKPVEGLRYE